MVRLIWRIIEHLLAPLPGWMFLLSGMALLGMAMIVPAWVESRHLTWRLDLMRAQAKCISQEHESFTQFNAGLASDDPILLERLAYYYLRLQPEGVTTLDAVAPSRSTWYGRRFAFGLSADNHASIMPALANRPISMPTPSVEEMLQQPLPEPGVNYPGYRAINTRLVRITTSWRCVPLIAAGILAVLAGLYMPTPEVVEDMEESDFPNVALEAEGPDDEAPFDPVVRLADEAPQPPPLV